MRIAMICAALLPLAACGNHDQQREGTAATPSGTGSTRSFAVNNFTGVELRGPDDVQVRVGPAFSVRAEGATEDLDRLDIRVVDGKLRVERKDQGFNWGGNHSSKGVKVFVTLPRIDSASVMGSGDMDVDRAEGNFSGAIAGSGDLKIAQLQATRADLAIAGSGDLTAVGQTGALSASIAGSGDIEASGLTATSADVSIAGSGNVRATVNGNANVSIVGSGNAELGGGAKCTVSKMGSGEARCS